MDKIIKLPKPVDVVSDATLAPLLSEHASLFVTARDGNVVVVKATKAMAEIELKIMALHHWKGSKATESRPYEIPEGPDFLKVSPETRKVIKAAREKLVTPDEMSAWKAVHGRDASAHPVLQSVDRYVRLMRFDFIKACGFDPHKWGVESAAEEAARKEQEREDRRIKAEMEKLAPKAGQAPRNVIEVTAEAVTLLSGPLHGVLATVEDRRRVNENLNSIRAAIAVIEETLFSMGAAKQ
jgi:hypothetical protein